MPSAAYGEAGTHGRQGKYRVSFTARIGVLIASSGCNASSEENDG
jgi:hypothetical protein